MLDGRIEQLKVDGANILCNGGSIEGEGKIRMEAYISNEGLEYSNM